ncbi:polysaccharide biosynthesis tyrosine autokinase [Solirubrobacter sp. CPCC 204708]|uniref:Polysaccharide biosynthesis tyrosine autokinase n=1 Tax=Solirubrobacter deserti TaxID=2282478 RepID=A0ABT4RSA7_9ACTN|nr:polysaccharide biosynthesis tyrosine autokinase [Solirubrobacter deserti]MBE2318745.1 polysaccharide biosynthesis tyrosine autokinase [Solirubrobacter deserti]MDA0141335.1 polysaccharide biosynthesis tyrosine autokinase [Solirubrobacter deserti]
MATADSLSAAPGRRAAADDIVGVVWRRRWIALSTFVAVLASVAALTASLTPAYEATGYMLVTPDRPVSSDFEQTQISSALLTTFEQLLQTQNLADEVKRRVGNRPGMPPEPANALTVEAVTDSQLLRVTTEAETPEAAQLLANTYTQVFQERTRQLASAGASTGKASVAEPATLPTNPVRPRPRLYLAAGALLAALAALGAALAAHRLDRRLEITDSMTEVLGLPIIGRIPQGSGADVERLLQGERLQSRDARAAAEGFRLVLANLTFANVGRRPRSVAIVSSDEQEGKSTVALSVGRAAGELDLPTLLVEADLRRPSLANKSGAGASSPRGFSSLLVHGATMGEAVWAVPDSSMDLLPAGPLPPNPAALLGSEALRDFDRAARERYELVLYDTPPLSVAADASLIASVAEGVVLVVDARRTQRRLAEQAVDQLRRSHTTIFGVVVNRVDPGPFTSGYYAEGPPDEQDGGRLGRAVESSR